MRIKVALFALLVFLAPLLYAQSVPSGPITLQKVESRTLIERAYAATAILYSQTEDGGMRMRCTATAYEKSGDVYKFVSAAHCVGEDDTEHERVEVDKTRFFVTFDESGEKKFHTAKLIAAGYQHRGDDFSVFEVTAKDSWPVIPLGDEKAESIGADVVNVASPMGLGRQVFHGYLSSLFLDRPVVEGNINWTGTMLLQIAGGPGSSGSSIVSKKQEAIVAFLVGHAADNFVAMPVSRFKKFLAMVEAKKYKWYQPSAAEDSSTSQSHPMPAKPATLNLEHF